jgi:hypothetical protein
LKLETPFVPSPHESIHQPHDKAQQNAEDDTGGNREEDGGVLSAIANIARQSSQGNAGSSRENHQQTYNNQQAAGANQ